MMKKGIVVSVCAVLLVAIAITLYFVFPINETIPEGVLARVNGISITEEQVNTVLEFNQIQMETYEKVFFENFANKEEAQAQLDEMALKHPTTKDGVLTYLIRGQVFAEELKDLGKEITLKEANDYFVQEVSSLKTEKTQQTVYTVLTQSLTSRGKTWEDYVKLGKTFSFAYYNTLKAKQNFKSSQYDANDSASLDEQFENYGEELLKKAEVERFS